MKRPVSLIDTICTNCLFNEAGEPILESGMYLMSTDKKSAPVLLIPCLLSGCGYVAAKRYKCKDFERSEAERMRIPFELTSAQRSGRMRVVINNAKPN